MGVGCHFLLQGIVSTQGSNLHLLHLPALEGRFFTIESLGKTVSFNIILAIFSHRNLSFINGRGLPMA